MSQNKQRATSLTIGQIARQAGVGVTTVRFYERAGILPRPARTAANYRLYDDDDAARIRFTRRAQELGFTLAEIKELLGLRVGRQSSCDRVRRVAEAKIAGIDARIASLRRMRRALVRLAEQCETTSRIEACPILKHLDAEDSL